MAEYIAREVLLAQLRAMESYNVSPMYRRGYDDCVEAILKAPAADVVPVVRCRDCRKRGLPECPMETEYPWIDADSDGFCNQGVKKKGEEHNND